jgi:hypothetical protein
MKRLFTAAALALLLSTGANAAVVMQCNPHVTPNPCYSFPPENIDPVVNAEVNRRQKENEVLDALKDRLRRPGETIIIFRRR